MILKGLNIVKKHHSMDFKNEIIQKIHQGSKVTDISELYELNPSTVYNWIKLIEINPSKSVVIKMIEKHKYDDLLKMFKMYSITNSMTVLERIHLIMHHQEDFPIKYLCELFSINRSTFYNFINHQTTPKLEYDKKIKVQISELCRTHRNNIGAAKIKVLLRENDIIVSEKKIRFLMTELGLKSTKIKTKLKYHRPRTTIMYKNILKQDFNQPTPNRVWISDITEIKINYKPVYLCVIIDLFSRKVIAYEISKVNNSKLTIITYKNAYSQRHTHPMIFHSDRGVQYTALAFRSYLKKNGVLSSYSAAGYPYDNAVMESFFAHFKKEMVYIKYPFTTVQSYKQAVTDYMDYYNKQRLHQGIGMITPNLKEGLYHMNIEQINQKQIMKN